MASIRQRLANLARTRGEAFDLVLTRYALERLLYRLGRSDRRDRFILKGAMLLAAWADAPYRSTRDLDLLGFGPTDPAVLAPVFKAICKLSVEDDGLHFDTDTIRIDRMRQDEEYEGARVRIVAHLGNARIPVQIDIGFGDVVTPCIEEIIYPTLLDQPAPTVRAYPKETVIAEKFESIVDLGMANSRLKDFYDLWVMNSTFGFDEQTLRQAVAATFERRGTALPVSVPIGLSEAFARDAAKNDQWRAFIDRTRPVITPPSLRELLSTLREFLLPLVRPSDAAVPAQRCDRKPHPGA